MKKSPGRTRGKPRRRALAVLPSASESAFDVVGAYVEQNIGIALDAEDEAIPLCDPAFPQVAVALGFLRLERGVTPVLYKKRELFPGSRFDGSWQSGEPPLELRAFDNPHRVTAPLRTQGSPREYRRS